MQIKLLFLCILAIAAGMIATGSIFTVQQTKQAIVLQFGEPKRVIRQSGLAFKLPAIQRVLFYDTRILDIDPPTFEMFLADRKRIIVDVYARYRIVDPLAFYRRVDSEAVLRDRFSNIINSSVRRVIATVMLSDLLSEKREFIMRKIQDMMIVSMKSFGIEIIDIRIGRPELPPQIRQSVYARMKTEREREAHQLRAEGRENALKIRAKAERDKMFLLADAERQAKILYGEGEAGRTRTLGIAFRKDSDFFDLYKSLNVYRRSFVNTGTTMVVYPHSEFFRFFNNEHGSKRLEGTR